MDTKEAWIAAEQEWLTQHLEAKKLREKAEKLKALWIESEIKKQKEVNDGL